MATIVGVLDPENECTADLCNVGDYLQNCIVYLSRRIDS
jgi:hypothetical protein